MIKILKWISLLCSILVFGQEEKVFVDTSSIELDSMFYQKTNNAFHEKDQLILLQFDPFEATLLSNFGSPLLPLWWNPVNNIDINIGDVLLKNKNISPTLKNKYNHNFPHTKIIYSPTYFEGQRLKFIHKRKLNNGSIHIDYNRLVSEGFLANEKNKNTQFNFYGIFSHPKLPIKSSIHLYNLKNESEWNGGINDSDAFLSEIESDWKVISVNWTNLNTRIKHKGLNWLNLYDLNSKNQIKYELTISQDSLIYDGLQDDTLFYPVLLDSVTLLTRYFTKFSNSLIWNYEINQDKKSEIGINYQSLSLEEKNTDQWSIDYSIYSESLQNHIYFALGKNQINKHSFIANYSQKIQLFRTTNKFKIGYERTYPNWIEQNSFYSSWGSNFEDVAPKIDQYFEWHINLTKNISINNSYHSIEGYTYYNENAIAVTDQNITQVFQSRLKHHLNLKKWHWKGDAGYQKSSSKNIPLAKIILNQNIYWQGPIFKEATEAQIGMRVFYRTKHPGIGFAPILGDFYVNPLNQTEASLKCDLFANFKIQTIKIYAAYEHLNGLFQGRQFSSKPFPMAGPLLRIGLIWNFYD